MVRRHGGVFEKNHEARRLPFIDADETGQELAVVLAVQRLRTLLRMIQPAGQSVGELGGYAFKGAMIDGRRTPEEAPGGAVHEADLLVAVHHEHAGIHLLNHVLGQSRHVGEVDAALCRKSFAFADAEGQRAGNQRRGEEGGPKNTGARIAYERGEVVDLVIALLEQQVMLKSVERAEIQQVLQLHAYKRFPVLQDGKLAGILTRKEGEKALLETRLPVLQPATTCLPDQTVRELQVLLIESPTHFVVLTSGNGGSVVGIVTLHDILRTQAEKAKGGHE